MNLNWTAASATELYLNLATRAKLESWPAWHQTQEGGLVLGSSHVYSWKLS